MQVWFLLGCNLYKDKEKQKEADRERQRRYRQGVTKGVTEPQGVTRVEPIKGVTSVEGVTKERAGKLLMICNALDKTMTGLDGKPQSLLTMVRYGVYGPTFREIKEQLWPR